ncbi:MAG: glycosyltransferase [Chloroflexi bacterium]|nr:glycosyltransferase [Chloroflexota bacterium]
MKVLQVFPLFSLPHGGGTVALLYKLSEALAKREHEVVIYTSNFELDQKYIDSLSGVTVYPFRCLSSLAGFYLMPGIIREAKRKLKNFDIIHLHCYRSFQNIVIHHYARKYGIPYVVDAHGSIPRAAGEKKDFKWSLKWLFDIIFGDKILRDASKVVAETGVGVSEYQKLGVNHDKIILLTPPLDTEEFSQLPPPGLFRRRYNIKERHILLFLGRIHWIKGLDFLVESFYKLVQSRSDVLLVIVGSDDGYKPSLDRLIDRLDLRDKVLFTGFLGGTEKLSALVDADVLVQTSIYEQGTGVPFEAILCNTPIIVSKNSGSGENISRIDAGYLVEWGNKNELSNTIQYVLDNPTEAQNKTQKAREYIKSNLSWAKGIEKYESLYARCIEENNLIMRGR